jgi:putative membrane protein
MRLLLSWLVLALSVWLTAAILPGFHVNGFGGAIWVAAIFGVLNWLLGRFIFVVLGIATLGVGFLLAFITRFIVMALLLEFSAALSSNFRVDGFGTAILGALLMSGIGTLAEYAIHSRTRRLR